ncbi:hypothetical protein PGN35_015105 [Nodosilinea sp. PGN35]|uniref:hypothetical protein n=1 Tax=Nodosilinea sp. PGN35 TaxID=3020489 RepID=UPI0023B22BFD|nr:hypothetical protein [Nodosilinea sp. TSF1-S3]MDF0369898.1 hypothetical protein [Nodosilinea sp. TSF1-S3]
MNTSYWPIHNPRSSSPVRRLGAFWQNLLAHLETTTEPRVWKVSESPEQTLWNAYDPITRIAIEHASADELRTWLEELHYRN